MLGKTLELFTYSKPEILSVLKDSLVSDSLRLNYENLNHSRFKQLG
jgi:hypothetical protein